MRRNINSLWRLQYKTFAKYYISYRTYLSTYRYIVNTTDVRIFTLLLSRQIERAGVFGSISNMSRAHALRQRQRPKTQFHPPRCSASSCFYFHLHNRQGRSLSLPLPPPPSSHHTYLLHPPRIPRHCWIGVPSHKTYPPRLPLIKAGSLSDKHCFSLRKSSTCNLF